MKTLYLIGMGPGRPEYLTLQAVAALRRVDVFFMLEKAGRGKDELLRMRQRILDEFLEPGGYRVVTAASPERARGDHGYLQDVATWHATKRALFARLLREELGDGQTGALLLWGDPVLYDQTVTMLNRVLNELDEPVALEVIPGISSLQVLTARHRIPLNRVGERILITTGRDAEHCDPATLDNAVVMLDYNASFQRFRGQEMDVYWGGYLGCDGEALMAGPVDEIADELIARKAALREERGWLMDTYLLRRRTGEPDSE